MDDSVNTHLQTLRGIAHAQLEVCQSDQFHRYFWLPETQVPQNLRSSEKAPRRLRSDYGYACKESSRFWRKLKRNGSDCNSSSSSALSGVSVPIISLDRSFVRNLRSLSKRDTVGRVLRNPTSRSEANTSLYTDSFDFNAEKIFATCRLAREYHIQVNPISKFGEALYLQRQTIRD